MAKELIGNCLVAQSGGPTAVINSSLAGVVSEALNHECIEEIYGGLNGILGILNEGLIDLASESQQTIRALRHTPGSALGTCRHKLKTNQDFERVLSVFEAHNIRYFFYIGGNDSQDTAAKISELAQEKGYELRVIGIPKTVDNDLAITDHCPGYGSVVKSITTQIKELALDCDSMGRHDYVSIVEVMGRNAGWIAAGSALAKDKNSPSDAPHLIYLPEVPFSQEKYLEDVQRVLKKERYCIVVVGEGLTDENGNYISSIDGSTDSFGHAELGGAGEYLKKLTEDNLGTKTRACKFGHTQRAAAHCSSQTDNDEAYEAGIKAVESAVDGESDKMVVLIRSDKEPYTCDMALAPLSDIANKEKKFPANWINEDQVSLNMQFFKYALPLIKGEVQVPYEAGLPIFAKLKMYKIRKALDAYIVE